MPGKSPTVNGQVIYNPSSSTPAQRHNSPAAHKQHGIDELIGPLPITSYNKRVTHDYKVFYTTELYRHTRSAAAAAKKKGKQNCFQNQKMEKWRSDVEAGVKYQAGNDTRPARTDPPIDREADEPTCLPRVKDLVEL